jgi:hypothetical protein
MTAEGYTGLVDMEGGMHGAFSQETGELIEAGWGACGLAETVESAPERTWEALRAD